MKAVLIINETKLELPLDVFNKTPEEMVGAKDYVSLRFWEAIYLGLYESKYIWEGTQEDWGQGDLQLYKEWYAKSSVGLFNGTFTQYAWKKLITDEVIRRAKIAYNNNIDFVIIEEE